MPDDIWWGDLFRALQLVDRDDTEAARVVAAMLGFAATAPRPEGPDAPAGEPERTGEPAREPRPTAPQRPARRHPSTAPAPASAAARPATGFQLLTPVGHEERPAIEWAVGSLPAPTGRHRDRPLPHEPLLPPRSASAILQLALARVTEEGAPDIPGTVRRLAEGRAVAEVPRQPVPTLRFGVQVLVDLGPGMEPFGRDQRELLTRIRNTVGHENTAVHYFEGCPLRGAGPGDRSTWSAYRAPARGTRVVLLSDLGLGGPALGLRRGTPEEWREWAALLDAAQCQAVAFVPYPRRRWPSWARGLLHLVQWDRSTTVGRVGRPTE